MIFSNNLTCKKLKISYFDLFFHKLSKKFIEIGATFEILEKLTQLILNNISAVHTSQGVRIYG
jgi:hypothetical protein